MHFRIMSNSPAGLLKIALVAAGVCVFGLGSCLPAAADSQQDTQNDIAALKAQVAVLAANNQKLLDTLNDLKKIEEARSGNPAAKPQGEPEVKGPSTVATDGLPSQGAGKVAIVEFGDFQCPHSEAFAKSAYAQIVRDYVKTGKVTFYFKDLAVGPHDRAAAAGQAAHCAGDQGKYWEMYASLYANQSALSDKDLKNRAKKLNLDIAKFETCAGDKDAMEQIQDDTNDLLTNGGISGTPTFLIGIVGPGGVVKVDKTLLGAKSYDTFKTALDAELAAAG